MLLLCNKMVLRHDATFSNVTTWCNIWNVTALCNISTWSLGPCGLGHNMVILSSVWLAGLSIQHDYSLISVNFKVSGTALWILKMDTNRLIGSRSDRGPPVSHWPITAYYLAGYLCVASVHYPNPLPLKLSKLFVAGVNYACPLSLKLSNLFVATVHYACPLPLKLSKLSMTCVHLPCYFHAGMQ